MLYIHIIVDSDSPRVNNHLAEYSYILNMWHMKDNYWITGI